MVRLTFSFGRLVFVLCLAPSRLGLPPSLPLPLPFLVALALCFGCFSRPPAAWLFVRSRLVCVSRLAVGCSLVVSPPPLSFLCLAVFVAPAWCLGVVFFFFFLFFFSFFFFLFSSFPSSPVRPLCAPGVSRFLWCPGPRRFALFALLAFCLSALRALVPLSCFPPGWWLLPGGCCPPPPPPPLFVSRFSWLALGAVPPWVRCCAALLRAVFSGVVLSCAVLCSLGAAACCAVPSGAARCPGALCSAALCFAGSPVLCVFCRGAVVRAVVLLCFVLCVSRGAVLCVPRPFRSVRCCASLCWWLALCCSCGACCCWRLVLWCAVVRCWVWWPVVVRWWRVSVSVSLSGRVVCFPCGWCGLLWCPAFLCRVLWCCAVARCCAVLLCFRVAVLLGLALRSCGLSCCVVLLVGCAVFCPVVVSACCGALFLVLCFPCLLRSVRCGALLCWLWCSASLCRVLWSCAVVWCCAVVLCCRFAVLFVWGVGCGLSCCAVLCCWLAVLFFARWWCLRAVVLFSSCCAFPVFSALCAAVPRIPCAVPRGAVLPPGAVVSCPAALLGVFLAWVWLYLLEKPLQNFVKYFFFLFFFFFWLLKIK